VDTSRISFGETVAGASGLALVVVMFLPWYGPPDTVAGLALVSNRNAWEAFSSIDILLFLVAATALGMALARAAGTADSLALIVAWGGALALGLIVFRLIAPPDPGETRNVPDLSTKIGVFLGLITAVGITLGGYTAMKEREGRQMAQRERRRL
jgi:uncharacterized membrane protein